MIARVSAPATSAYNPESATVPRAGSATEEYTTLSSAARHRFTYFRRPGKIVRQWPCARRNPPPSIGFISKRPTPEAGSGRKARSYGREHHQVASLQSAGGDSVPSGQRDGCRRRIPVPFQVDHHLFKPESRAFGRRAEDAPVRLMRNPEIEVSRTEAITGQQFQGQIRECLDGVLEHRLALQLDEMLAFLDRFDGCRQTAATGRQTRAFGAGAIRVGEEIDEAGARVVRCAGG